MNEIKGLPSEADGFTPDQMGQIAQIKVDEIRKRCQDATLEALQQGLANGIPPADIIVLQVHSREPILEESVRKAMALRGQEVGVFPAKRLEFAAAIRDYDAKDGVKPYKELADVLQRPAANNGFWIVTLWNRHAAAIEARLVEAPEKAVSPAA